MGSAARLVQAVAGAPAPVVPARIAETIRAEQDRSEILVGIVQLGAVAGFAALYVLVWGGGSAMPHVMGIAPIPLTLALYGAVTLARLALAWRRRLADWMVGASIVIDVAVLLCLIWSFHLQYQQPVAFVLKAPTLAYLFILVALRALRFEARWVLAAGACAVTGWLALIADALADRPDALTMDFVAYMTGARVLPSAEFDKLVALAAVSLVLALVVTRARRLLVRATFASASVNALGRFFAPEVARAITCAHRGIMAGQAEMRDAAVLFIDLRGFTRLSAMLEPAALMALLGAYQGRMVPVIHAHGGSIDKFLGDGILVSFGAAVPSATYAADAVRCVGSLDRAARAWIAERHAAGLPAPLGVGFGLAAGRVLFGAVGDGDRLEYTLIGDAVNLAAKLEKHNKTEGVSGLCPASLVAVAAAQGYATPAEIRPQRTVSGLDEALDLAVLVPRHRLDPAVTEAG